MLSHNNSNLAHEAIVFSEEEARQFIYASPILLASLTDAMKIGSHYTHLRRYQIKSELLDGTAPCTIHFLCLHRAGAVVFGTK